MKCHYLHATEYYAAVQRTEGELCEVVWNDFPDIWLIGKNKVQKNTVSVTCCLTKGVRNKHMYLFISANRNKKDKIETSYMFMGGRERRQ